MLVERLSRVSQHVGLQLHDAQREVCLEYMKGNDVILIAPTGYGKSVLFQLAPLLLSPQAEPLLSTIPTARVIIVMPTVALIKDSISKLKSRFSAEMTMPAVHLTRATLDEARDATFLFSSPEALLDAECGRRLFADMPFITETEALFFDECHLLQEWGETDRPRDVAFRAQFSQMGTLRAIFPRATFVAMTATATQATTDYVKKSLGMTNPKIVRVDVNKKNISYHLIMMREKSLANFDWLVTLIRRDNKLTPRMLVFFVDALVLSDAYSYITHHCGQAIGDCEPIVGMFSSLTSEDRKTHVLNDLNLQDSALRVVLCTSSLSVGVNLSNIQCVVHYNIPTATNAFIQETGRAGREAGSRAVSLVIGYPKMLAGRRASTPMKNFVATKGCRRKVLLANYSQQQGDQTNCCDNCDAERPEYLPRRVPSQLLMDCSDMSSLATSDSASVGDVIFDTDEDDDGLGSL